jgi:hypothetical protein
MENEDISTDLRKKDINLQEEFNKDSKVELSESDRLGFAKEVLYGITFLVISGSVSYAIFPDNKALVQNF